MADLGATLLSFPPEKQLLPAEYEKAIAQYITDIETISSAEWTKSLGKSNIFDILNPEVNSIAYLYSLWHSISQVNGNVQAAQPIFPQIRLFFQDFDPIQINYTSGKWAELYAWTADAVIAMQQKDVEFLAGALQRFTTDLASFTSSHLTYVRLCVQAQVPSLACLILDHDIYSIASARNAEGGPQPSNTITNITQPETLLEYYLLGAEVYVGLSNWARARLFLEFIILHPSIVHAVSMFQVEAYKKWLLIGLLISGGSSTSLRTSDQLTMKNIRAVSKPYDVLADTFRSRDWRKLQAEVDDGAEIWREDGNTRLAQAVSDAVLAYCVSDLQKTYASAPLSVVAKHLKLGDEQTLGVVQNMIQQGRLKASLVDVTSTSPSHKALQFVSEAQSRPKDFAHDTIAQTQRIDNLVRAIADADRRLRLTKEYLDVTRRAKRQTVENDPADQMDLEWHASNLATDPLGDDRDEDIMA